MLVVIIFATLLFAVATLAGLRARQPMPAVRALIANPERRPVTWGMLMLRDISTFIDPAADASVDYSFRYDGKPFSLETVAWSFALASTFVTVAILFGWLFFDIQAIGDWAFFKEDTPFLDRTLHAGTWAAFLLTALYAAADSNALIRNFFAGSEDAFWGAFVIIFLSSFCLLTWLWGNHGLSTVACGAFLFIPSYRKVLLGGLTLMYIDAIFGFQLGLTETQAAFYTYIIVVAVMALASFFVTVEILSALRWFQPEASITTVVGLAAILGIAMACALAIPVIMIFILYAIMMLTPDTLNAGWLNTVGVFREGGASAAMILAISCIPPLLPAMWFVGSGLGTFITRNTPMMAHFLANLRISEGDLTQEEFNDLLDPYRSARVIGYSVAAFVTMLMLGVAVVLMSRLYIV